MKKLIRLLFISTPLFFLFQSCENQDLNCSSNASISLLKDIYLDDLRLSKPFKEGLIDLTYTNRFLNEKMSFNLIRKTAVDEKLKNCDCEAKVEFELDENFIKDIRAMENEYSSMEYFVDYYLEDLSTIFYDEYFDISNMLEDVERGVNISYKIQLLDDGDIMIETYPIESLALVIYFYQEYEKNIEGGGDITKNKTNINSINERNSFEIQDSKNYYQNPEITYDFCFYKVLKNEDDHISVKRLQLQIKDSIIKGDIGDYNFYFENGTLSYYGDPYVGEITGKHTNSGFIGYSVYFSEGEYINKPFTLILDDNLAKYNEDIKVVNNKIINDEGKKFILNKTGCS